MSEKEMVLPYRVDAADLVRFIGARARGRDISQIATLGFSKKGLEGTITAASELGLVESESTALTEDGRRLALASSDDARREILLEGMLRFPPYGLLLEAIHATGNGLTALNWIETWWNTHGFGSSGSNRSEGSSTLARLVEYTRLGSYVQGRRGHQSRIEWMPEALTRALESTDQKGAENPAGLALPKDDRGTEPDQPPAAKRGNRTNEGNDSVELSLPLGGGRTVELRFPRVVSRTEKERLLRLLDVLIVEGDAGDGHPDERAERERLEE